MFFLPITVNVENKLKEIFGSNEVADKGKMSLVKS